MWTEFMSGNMADGAMMDIEERSEEWVMAGAATADTESRVGQNLRTVATATSVYEFNGSDDSRLIKPPLLRGKVTQIDPIGGIVVSTASSLLRGLNVTSGRISVIVAARITHRNMISEFARSVDDGAPSAAKFASCALNASASMVALALGVDGPTLTLCGRTASLANAYKLARMYLQREDADVVLVLEASLVNDSRLDCHGYAVSQ